MTEKTAPPAIICRLRPLIFNWQVKNGRHLTFDELASGTGVAEKTLRQWAKDDVSMYSARVLISLCRFFSVTVGDILVFVIGKSEQVQ